MLLDEVDRYIDRAKDSTIIIFNGIIPVMKVSSDRKREEKVAMLAYALGKEYDITIEGVERTEFNSMLKGDNDNDPRRGGGDQI